MEARATAHAVRNTRHRVIHVPTALSHNCVENACIHFFSSSTTGIIPLYFVSILHLRRRAFQPLPSQQAVERSTGMVGNGTMGIVYFKGQEFAVKRVRMCVVDMHIVCTHVIAHF